MKTEIGIVGHIGFGKTTVADFLEPARGIILVGNENETKKGSLSEAIQEVRKFKIEPMIPIIEEYEYKDGKERRRERRKNERKNK